MSIAIDACIELSDGNPGAIVVIRELSGAFPRKWSEILMFLMEHGPRADALWVRYRDLCGEDAELLGRDLLARMSEWRD
jgi:hypothetical protein